MSKILNGIKKYEAIKSPIQWAIYGVIAAAVISSIIGVIFGVRSCKSKDTIETVEAKYFMNETVVVHENFDVTVYYAKTTDTIAYLKKKKDTNKTEVHGNYIEVNLDVTKKTNSTEKDHKLDANDFRLRNHSGVYLPLNTILGLFDIDAVDVHIDTDENGFVMSTANFNYKNAVKDYTWIDTKLKNGETLNLTLYFNLKEGYKVEKDLMLLEVDFYRSGIGMAKGEDIVLLNCKRS